MLFSAAALILLLVPGPAVLYIIARSATQGSRAGLLSVAGIHAGTAVHVLAGVGGLSGVLVTSATAFIVVKLIGAAYLIHLGIRSLLDYRNLRGDPLKPLQTRSSRRIFLDGILVNVLNPKTAVFFLAFVPQFVEPTAGEAVTQLLVLSAVYIGLGLISDGMYALVGAWLGDRSRRVAVTARRTSLVAGTTYIGLGLATAVSGSSAQP